MNDDIDGKHIHVSRCALSLCTVVVRQAPNNVAGNGVARSCEATNALSDFHEKNEEKVERTNIRSLPSRTLIMTAGFGVVTPKKKYIKEHEKPKVSQPHQAFREFFGIRAVEAPAVGNLRFAICHENPSCRV